MTSPKDVTVFIDPFSWHFLRNELFNRDNPINLDNGPYFYLQDYLQSRGVEVHTADYLIRNEKVNKINIYISLGLLNYEKVAERKDTILSAFFTIDAPIIQPSMYRSLSRMTRYFKRIYSYTTGDALARFGCAGLKLHKFYIPYPHSDVFEELWSNKDRKFLVLLNYNRLPRMRWHELYTERLRALEFFSQFDEIDLYGMAWDIPPYRVGETWIPATFTRINRYLRQHVPFLRKHPYEKVIRKVYRGVAQSKLETQSHYTFTICYENMTLPGWINENIFDCFVAGTVPVYLGPPDITDYVPANCFIDKRQFPTYAELRSFLKSLSERDIQTYKENAREYLRSEKFRPFTQEAFVERFVRMVEEDAGIALN